MTSGGNQTDTVRTRTDDPRELPAYTVSEAAHYLTVPAATIRDWSVRRHEHAPIIKVPARGPTLLSFINLTELHVLAAIRRGHEVKTPGIRRVTECLAANARQAMDQHHPLISRALETDGFDLFIEQYGLLINADRAGRSAMRKIIGEALRRIDRDPEGIPIKLYPFTRASVDAAPSIVVIDPRLSAGRPVISGTGLATQLIAERYKAGESICDLADDYGRGNEEIEEAIRCELRTAS